MRKVLTIISFFVSPMMLLAQEDWSRQDKLDWKDADFAFYQGDYTFAKLLLEDLQKKHADHLGVQFELGASYVMLGTNIAVAKEMLEKAKFEGNSEAIFYLARANHQLYHFEKSLTLYSQYQSLEDKEQTTEKVEKWIKEARLAQHLTSNPIDVKVKNLGPTINGPFKEYVPIVTPDNKQLYFTSRRPESTGGLKDQNNEFFEDIFESRKVGNEWKQAAPAVGDLNTKTHDATVSISKDGMQMIVYRTNQNLTGGDLYISEKKEGKWGKPKLLNKRINTSYQEASACFGADNNTIYFSSNRPGGFGGKDLYRVVKLPNGEWSLPKNLGPTINTTYDEDAPYMDIDGSTLYFASNGHETIGGYDIFYTRKVGREVWKQPENLGYPVNTVFDDLFLSLDAGGRIGYYSSDQQGGFGLQDIYQVDFIYRQQTEIIILGTVLDAESQPIHATLTVMNETNREVQGVYKSHMGSGKFILVLNPLIQYRIVIKADGYKTIVNELMLPFPEDNYEEQRIAPYIMLAE